MHTKTRMIAASESRLSSSTSDIRQPDLTSSIGEASCQSNTTYMNQRRIQGLERGVSCTCAQKQPHPLLMHMHIDVMKVDAAVLTAEKLLTALVQRGFQWKPWKPLWIRHCECWAIHRRHLIYRCKLSVPKGPHKLQ